jgi:predicted thioesterase
VTATDGSVEIGNGKHTRLIIETERFMAKTQKKKP